MATDDDSRRPHVPTNAELRRLLRSPRGTPGRSTALGELVERAPRGLNRTLTDLALDPDVDQPLRVDAVAALGRETTTSALDGLRAAVATDDQVVVQRAIERLGKVGRPDDLDVLRRVRSGNRTTQRVLRTAKCFLSYRHRLGAYRVDAPKRRLPASEGAAEIDSSPPSRTIRQRFELVAPPVPGIALGDRPLRMLTCGPNDFALVLNDEIADDGLESLGERQALPAVLTRYNNETGAYDPSYYFLTDPARPGTFRVVGMRGSGRTGLFGTASVAENSISFEVNATEEPLDHPLTVRGTFDLGRGALSFDVAQVDATFSDAQQRRRAQPRPVAL